MRDLLCEIERAVKARGWSAPQASMHAAGQSTPELIHDMPVETELCAKFVGERPACAKPLIHRSDVIGTKAGQPAGIVERLSNDFPGRLVPLQLNQDKRAVRGDGDKVDSSTGIRRLLARLRQLSPLTDDNLLILRDRTPKGRHYTERPGDPPTGLQDSSFGAGCFGNAKSS